MFERDMPVQRAPLDPLNLWPDLPPQAEPESDLPKPVPTDDRSRNPLRPSTWEEVVGQERAVRMMRRVVTASQDRGVPLDHILLVAASGTGKSTFSHVIATELGVRCFEVEAPISHETLLQLREAMRDGEILRIEEIHQQAIMERRGRGAGTEPEVLYNVLEDRTIVSDSEVLPFPQITVIGTTTDEGMLPEPFVNRFPLRPRLESYTVEELAKMAVWNAEQLELRITDEAAHLFASASRGVPRQMNNYMKNAALLCESLVDEETAREVLHDLNDVTPDGLTADMQGMLRFLYQKGKRTNARGEITYQAGVGTLATALGKSRDAKAIALRVEPWLITEGLVQVGHAGRILTDAGIERARELLQ